MSVQPWMWANSGDDNTEPPPPPDAGDPNKYGGSTTIGDVTPYTPKSNGSAMMPAAGDLPQSALYTKVDYNWMAYLGKVLRDLDPEFGKAIDGLAPLTFNPGTRFSQGREFQNEILGRSGGDGIKGAAVENLAHFRQAVAEMAGKVEKLAKSYAHSDELSHITAERVTKDMTDVLGQVNLMPDIALPGGGSDGGGHGGGGHGGGHGGAAGA